VDSTEVDSAETATAATGFSEAAEREAGEGPEPEAVPAETAVADPFEEIDFGSFFDDYLDPGYKSPAAESVEKPSFETFLSAPMTLCDHLRSQLSISVLDEKVRDAAETIIGNLDEDGYLMASLEEIATSGITRWPMWRRRSEWCNRSIRPAWARAI